MGKAADNLLKKGKREGWGSRMKVVDPEQPRVQVDTTERYMDKPGVRSYPGYEGRIPNAWGIMGNRRRIKL